MVIDRRKLVRGVDCCGTVREFTKLTRINVLSFTCLAPRSVAGPRPERVRAVWSDRSETLQQHQLHHSFYHVASLQIVAVNHNKSQKQGE